MPPLPTPLPALRSLTRIYAKPTSSHHLLRQSPLPRIQHQYQHLPLKRFTPSAFYSTTSSPSPLTSPPSSQATHKPKPHTPKPPQQTIPTPENPKPEYEMTFTCTPCSTRSSHRVSKQGYHKGSVLITCPECKNRHVISDHLGIFGDKTLTIEDLMREKGQLVKKGTLSEDGNFEFWADGTTTTRAKATPDNIESSSKEGEVKSVE